SASRAIASAPRRPGASAEANVYAVYPRRRKPFFECSYGVLNPTIVSSILRKISSEQCGEHFSIRMRDIQKGLSENPHSSRAESSANRDIASSAKTSGAERYALRRRWLAM